MWTDGHRLRNLYAPLLIISIMLCLANYEAEGIQELWNTVSFAATDISEITKHWDYKWKLLLYLAAWVFVCAFAFTNDTKVFPSFISGVWSRRFRLSNKKLQKVLYIFFFFFFQVCEIICFPRLLIIWIWSTAFPDLFNKRLPFFF